MNLVKIEIYCPECGRPMSFRINTSTDDINCEDAECKVCGKTIRAVLEFMEVE